jgi:hypothetical protein
MLKETTLNKDAQRRQFQLCIEKLIAIFFAVCCDFHRCSPTISQELTAFCQKYFNDITQMSVD